MDNQPGTGSAVSPANVGLNCGTLIVIAIVVFFVSGMREPEYAVKMRQEVGELRKQADAQVNELQAIRKLLEVRLPPADLPDAPRRNP